MFSPSSSSSLEANSPLAGRRYPLRRSPPSRKRHRISPQPAHDAYEQEPRRALYPLHQNLRRLPSRVFSADKVNEMNTICVGGKRKRVASGSNENSNHQPGRQASRGTRQTKRFKPSSCTSDDDVSSMEVDSGRWSSKRSSGLEQEVGSDDDVVDDEDNDQAEWYISSAESHDLIRLRKSELIRLYTLAGLTDDADALTKADIVENIIAARDDLASLPPSSPLGRGGGLSDSSDEAEQMEEDESETPRFLRRRATTNDMSRGTQSRPLKSRSLSMGHLDNAEIVPQRSSRPTRSRQKSGESSSSATSSRRRSTRSSPTNSTSSYAEQQPMVSISSPPAHHLRSRKISAPTLTITNGSSSLSSSLMAVTQQAPKVNGKGKSKQVEFQTEVDGSAPTSVLDDESDLTELEELEAQLKISPRRTRSQDKTKRVTPMRTAKKKIKTLKEESSEEAEDEEVDEIDEDEGEEDPGDIADEDEVDQLVSSQRTPMKRRLRPRNAAGEQDPSDGDDEAEDDEEEEGDEAEGDEAEDEEAEEEDDDATLTVEPRKLRNGKIVGEEDVEMEEDIEETGEEDEDEEGEEEEEDEEGGAEEAEEEDPDAEGETDEEAMESEEDVDLTVATAKTLTRMRRDDLVRLCESRALQVSGNKSQLADALLQWRDRQQNSSPSSTGTVRPPSTVKRLRTRQNGRKTDTPPVLLRSERVHLDEPRTPPAPAEAELELDLGTLGLEDREIPSEKLQKLEKIGSGGFKDVYIGKFKGRRVAISEFRGQLSAMDIKELKLLGGFNHPNIVRFLGVSIPENTKETPVMIVSELCTNGDLFDYVRNVNPPTLHKVLTIMLDIARGLEYLHTQKPSIIHRDCKSSNILITSKGNAKIADFGLAKVKQSTRSMVRSLVGTVNWQAPELWHAHPKYNHKVDVFSCACVFWEMLQWHIPNKKYPWEGMNEHAIYEIVGTKRQRPSITGLRKQWCPEVVDLIERMWAHEHQDRPTMTEVVEELSVLVKQY